MKQPIVKVDGTYYNVSSVQWYEGNLHDISIKKDDGKLLTIFAPSITQDEWHSIEGSKQKGYNRIYHSVEFVEEVTA